MAEIVQHKPPEIVDLCDSSDDDENGVEIVGVSTSITNRVPSVARAPFARDEGEDFPPSHYDENDVEVFEIPSVARAPSPSDEEDSNAARAPRKRKRPLPKPGSGIEKRKHSPGLDKVEVLSVKTGISPLAQVLEVFPDVKESHANQLLKDHSQNVAMVLSYLSDGTYPKDGKSEDGMFPASGGFALQSEVPRYDYLDPASFQPSDEYQSEAIEQLLFDFPFMSRSAVTRWLKNAGGHYSIVREKVLDSLAGKNLKDPDRGSSTARTTDEEEERYYNVIMLHVNAGKRPTSEQLRRLGEGNTVKSPRKRQPQPPSVTESVLREEIEYSKAKLSRWMAMIKDRLRRKSARLRAQSSGTAVACTCCFEDVSMEEMTACESGHLLCMDCLKNYAESQIFGSGNLGIDRVTKKPALELKCCHGDGCNAGFSEEYLRRALPAKTLLKYNQIQFQLQVQKAGLGEAMCACPKCGFEADMPSTQMIFECPVSSCRFHSCRKCGKAAHIPLRCDEVVKQKIEDEGRLKVEEAISAAKIRICPKCKKSFIKSDGCNKMSCPCGRKVCYICRKDITREGYKHFCQVPHCNHSDCGKCLLHTNADQDDERAMREAGVTAAERYKEQIRTEDPKSSAKVDINLDVDKILGSSSGAKGKGKKKTR